MTCPRCHFDFDNARSVCPECGVRLLRSISGVIKTSAVMIAAGRRSGFYRSVQEVPEPLRTQLMETTGSRNSGTILIADRAGKEQLTLGLARREAARADASGQPSAELQGNPAGRLRTSWLAWSGLVLVLILAAVISVLFGLRW